MSLSRNQKIWIIILSLCLLMAILLIWQPVSFAWMASALRSSTFSVKSSSVSTLDAELWTYAHTAYKDANGKDDWAKAWYAETIIQAETDTSKRFSSIGTFTTTTFTPASPIALHFGTINNLVQENENQPIYLKFSIKLKPNTSNTVILSYKNDTESVGGQYISVYSIDFKQADATTGEYLGNAVTNETLLNNLNLIDKYPFLRFHYFVSTTDYTIGDGVDNLTKVLDKSTQAQVDFDALFEGDNVTEYTLDDTDTHSITCDNNTSSSPETYIYIKINVRSDTLADALTNTDLKNYMPAYLLFAVVLGVEIRTTAYNS